MFRSILTTHGLFPFILEAKSVEYRDADDAIRGRDGYSFDGYRLRVESPRGNGPRMGRGGGPPPHGKYRVLISGLPNTGSWQDLKDHMREVFQF